MNKLRAKLDYALKHNALISRCFRFSASAAVRMLGLFTPMDDKAVLFSALNRKYNDSPKAIYEYMVNDPRFQNYKFYWALDNPEQAEAFAEEMKAEFPDRLNAEIIVAPLSLLISCHIGQNGLGGAVIERPKELK